MSVVTSIYITAEDKRNLEKLKRARPGVPVSHLIREMITKEVALLEHRQQ